MRCGRWRAPAGPGSGPRSSLRSAWRRSDGTSSSGLSATRAIRTPREHSTSDIARFTVGSLFDRYKGLIGYFGWLDTPSPALTYVLWTAGVGFVVLAALAWTAPAPSRCPSRRYRRDRRRATRARVGGVWRRRWARVAGPLRLPLAVGVPIVATMAIASPRTEPAARRAPTLRRSRRGARRRAHSGVRPEPPPVHRRLRRRDPVLEEPGVVAAVVVAADRDDRVRAARHRVRFMFPVSAESMLRVGEPG